MKRIAIFGSYNGTSIGDTAILLGLIQTLHRLFGDSVQITVLAMGRIDIGMELAACGSSACVREVPVRRVRDDAPWTLRGPIGVWRKIARRFWPSADLDLDAVSREVAEQDLLLIGGGNLIMDLFPAWPRLLGQICEQAVRARVPYAFLGVGAGPIFTQPGRRSLLACLEGASRVYFRDSASKRYCESHLGFTRSRVAPDLAFGLELLRPNADLEQKDYIAVNIASVFAPNWPYRDAEKFGRYISGMCSLVAGLAAASGLQRVVLFSTNHPLDHTGAIAFIDRLKAMAPAIHASYRPERLTVCDLSLIPASARFAVVTRLHAGIIAALGGAKVVAVAYQPKVKDVLETIGATVTGIDDVMSGPASCDDVVRQAAAARATEDVPLLSRGVCEMVRDCAA